MKVTKSDFEKTLTITKLCASTIGVSLYHRGKPLSKSRKFANKIRFKISYFIALSGVLGGFMDMIYNLRVNFLAATHVTPCCCYGIISLFGIASVVSNLERANHLLDVLEHLWPTTELNDIQTAIIVNTMNLWNSVKNYFTLYNLIFLAFFNFSPIVIMILQYINTGEITKALPYYIYMPFDTMGTFMYPIAYILQLSVSYNVGVGLLVTDMLFLTIISHVAMQLKLLKYKIENLVEAGTLSILQIDIQMDHGYHQELYAQLIECIKLHCELIEITDTVEDIFSLPIFINFLCSTIMICCVGFQFTASTGVDLVIFLLFLGMSLLQTLVLCLAGDYLIETSGEIADAAYNSSWYLMDKKFRQLIEIIIQRAQQPQKVTAFRFSVVSFRSFSSILSSSYSYFTLLRTTYNGK